MTVFHTMAVTGSALTAHRLWMDTIAGNIANINTTRSEEGGPYRRRVPVFQSTDTNSAVATSGGVCHGTGAVLAAHHGATRMKGCPLRCTDVAGSIFGGVGVRVAAVVKENAPPRLVYDPSHPDADEDGWVAYPAIDLASEMVDMVAASRAYEANVAVLSTTKAMAMRALEIGRNA